MLLALAMCFSGVKVIALSAGTIAGAITGTSGAVLPITQEYDSQSQDRLRKTLFCRLTLDTQLPKRKNTGLAFGVVSFFTKRGEN